MELLRDRSTEFEDAGVRVMAASRDSAWSHVAWIQALDLNFPLLSDWNGDAVRGFGIARDYRGMSDVAWSPGARWLLLGWQSADQWLFLRSTAVEKVKAVSSLAQQFDPGGTGAGPFPRIEGWCCGG